MDGLADLVQRVGQIQATLSTLTVPTAVPPTGSFARALTAATTAAAGSETAESRVQAQPGTGRQAQAPSAAWNRLAALSSPASPIGALLGGGTPSTTHTLPVELESGRLTAAGVPDGLKAYGNGKVPEGALERIGGQGHHRLWAPAAHAFTAMEASAARDGVRLDVTDSYRSLPAQAEPAERKGLYSQGGLAARPAPATMAGAAAWTWT